MLLANTSRNKKPAKLQYDKNADRTGDEGHTGGRSQKHLKAVIRKNFMELAICNAHSIMQILHVNFVWFETDRFYNVKMTFKSNSKI